MSDERRKRGDGLLLTARGEKEWRRERFERQVANGELTVRFVCPRCGGSHHVRDCPHVIDRVA